MCDVDSEWGAEDLYSKGVLSAKGHVHSEWGAENGALSAVVYEALGSNLKFVGCSSSYKM